MLLVTGNQPGHHDVVSFWASGRQIDHHANPYDSAAILKTERSAGFSDSGVALIMRNPPSALLLVMPLGLLGSRIGSLLWSLMLLGALGISIHMLWVMHGRPNNMVPLLAYSFGPALTCILSGQTALFALAGLVLFLRFHEKRQVFAGLALWLCALKPHLFLPFGAVVLLWIFASRSYRILAAAILALVSSSLFASYLDPSVWTQYLQMARSSGIEREFIPCLGVGLRFAIRPQAMWLEYVPAAAGCVWATYFYWRRRGSWDWMEDGAVLMLVSILVAPYEWPTDQALLIPAILVGVYRATSWAQLGILALASAMVEVATLAGIGMHSLLYLWTSPFWLAWYLYVSAKAKSAKPLERIVQSDDWLQHGAL